MRRVGRWRWGWVAVLPVLACAHRVTPGRGREGKPSPVAPPPVEELRIALASTAAATYGPVRGGAAPTDPFAVALSGELDAVARGSRRAAPSWDPRLAAAAGDLAEIVPESGPLSYGAIEFVAHHHGIVEPTPHLVVVFSSRSDPVELAGAMRERVAQLFTSGAYNRVGVGIASRGDGRRAIIVAMQESHLTLEPVPRRVEPNASVRLRGRIDSPFTQPLLTVTREGGKVDSQPMSVTAKGVFSGNVACAGQRGRLRVEIAADSPQGATVLANFPIFCGVEPPRQMTATVTLGEITDLPAAEARMVELVNAARANAGLAPLAIDTEVAGVARRYSEEMARTGEVVHVSSESGDASARLRRAGVVRAVVRENLARSASPEEAHQSLLDSPGHRANILAADVTHVGVGIAKGGDADATDLFFTELYVRVPEKADVAAAARAIGTRLARARKLAWDDELARAATAGAAELARRGGGDAAVLKERGVLTPLTQRFKTVRAMTVAVVDPKQVEVKHLPNDPALTHLGVGVAQGDHPSMGPGALWVVVLLGVRP